MTRLQFIKPVEDSQQIWRYLDFSKFVALFLSSSLYFRPAYFLRQAEPFEFRHPKRRLDETRKQVKQSLVDKGLSVEQTERMVQQCTSPDLGLFCWAVNCWTARAHESYALWKTFIPNSDGVAIKSTVGRIRNAIADPNRLMYAGLVDYIDYNSEDYIPNDHSIGFEQLFHKARFYEHESEFRLAVLPEFDLGPLHLPEVFSSPGTSASLQVPVTLTTLIEEVRVSPYAEPWFHNLIREFVRTHFGETLPIVESSMRSAKFLD